MGVWKSTLGETRDRHPILSLQRPTMGFQSYQKQKVDQQRAADIGRSLLIGLIQLPV